MDLSALIFVALAVAWAVYLVPKALRHHEEDAVSRSIDGFSDRMRVLARREPVSATKAELVTTGRPRAAEKTDGQGQYDGSAASTPAPRADASTRSELAPAGAELTETELRRYRQARRAAARRAAERRRRVFTTLLLALVAVGALAIGTALSALWILAPLVLLAGWLVACRRMVRSERAARPVAPVRKRRRTLADEIIAEEEAHAVASDDGEPDDLTDTDSFGAVRAETTEPAPEADDPNRWAPVDVPLPTYVAKAPATRTVRTIDLDSTGVWSSGRNEADSQLAREAEAQRGAPESGAESEQRRASGS